MSAKTLGTYQVTAIVYFKVQRMTSGSYCSLKSEGCRLSSTRHSFCKYLSYIKYGLLAGSCMESMFEYARLQRFSWIFKWVVSKADFDLWWYQHVFSHYLFVICPNFSVFCSLLRLTVFSFVVLYRVLLTAKLISTLQSSVPHQTVRLFASLIYYRSQMCCAYRTIIPIWICVSSMANDFLVWDQSRLKRWL